VSAFIAFENYLGTNLILTCILRLQRLLLPEAVTAAYLKHRRKQE
jgi:hypothetical protein